MGLPQVSFGSIGFMPLKKLLMDAENNVEEVGEKADAAKQAAIAAEAAAAVAEEKRKGGKFF
mgnify:CR=1 FL=1